MTFGQKSKTIKYYVNVHDALLINFLSHTSFLREESPKMAYILLIGITILIICIALSLYFCLKYEGNDTSTRRRNQLNNYPIIDISDNNIKSVTKLDLFHQQQRNVFVIECCEKSIQEKECQQELPPSYCSLFPE